MAVVTLVPSPLSQLFQDSGTTVTKLIHYLPVFFAAYRLCYINAFFLFLNHSYFEYFLLFLTFAEKIVSEYREWFQTNYEIITDY